MQRLTVRHSTIYRYCRPVEFGEHRLMIRPRDSHSARLLSATLTMQPDGQIRWLHDVFGNSVAIATITTPSDRLEILSEVVIDNYPPPAEEFPIEPYAWQIPFSYPAREIPDLGRTIERHYPDPERMVTEWTRRFLGRSDSANDTQAFLLNVTKAIKAEFKYAERHTPGVQTPVETLEIGAGSCRDLAVFMMEAVRSVGLAARFVSGYLYDPAIDGADSDIAGSGHTHAWVQIYLPGAGWIEFDPTNGAYGSRNLVPVAVAREPSQAVPIAGTYDGEKDDFIDMQVDVTVRSVQRQEDAA